MLEVSQGKRVCERMIEQAMIEVSGKVCNLLPLRVVEIAREKVTVRTINKVVDEESIKDKWIKGKASMYMATVLVDEPICRMEIECRIRQSGEEGRLRIRSYAGKRVGKTWYKEIYAAEMKLMAEEGRLRTAIGANGELRELIYSLVGD